MSDHHIDELPEGMLGLGWALVAATVSPDGEPRAARASAWSVVDPTAPRARVAIAADDPVLIDNLRDDPAGGYVSVTGADVTTLRSLQLKGRVVLIEEPDAADLDLIARHQEVFVSTIEAIDGHGRDVVQRFLPTTVAMVELIVDEVYDQTPGPDAGAVLRAGWQ